MSKVLIEEQTLYDIASAIRDKNGAATTYKPTEMIAAIGNIGYGHNILSPTILGNLGYNMNINRRNNSNIVITTDSDANTITINGVLDTSTQAICGYNLPNIVATMFSGCVLRLKHISGTNPTDGAAIKVSFQRSTSPWNTISESGLDVGATASKSTIPNVPINSDRTGLTDNAYFVGLTLSKNSDLTGVMFTNSVYQIEITGA